MSINDKKTEVGETTFIVDVLKPMAEDCDILQQLLEMSEVWAIRLTMNRSTIKCSTMIHLSKSQILTFLADDVTKMIK